ncbi:MAG: signal peptidase I [Bdellovibrio sp.]|nr:signal peptidase I [Bdellovibrio sp.]
MVDHRSHSPRSPHPSQTNHPHPHSGHTHPSGKNPGGSANSKRLILENLVSLAVALLIVFAVRSSIIEPFKIPSGSMIPTLLIGDHIFVNKFAYGLKVPFSDLIGERPVFLIPGELPKRGDIVVFVYPRDESIYYVKRVVGLPGDTVDIRNKVLYVNNTMISRELASASAAEDLFYKLDDPKYTAQNLDLYTENLDQSRHLIMLDKTNFSGESHGPFTVPPDSLFVMGDNRDFSNDSRFWGFVPMKNVKGKAVAIWLSLSFDPLSFRPSRIGTVLK